MFRMLDIRLESFVIVRVEKIHSITHTHTYTHTHTHTHIGTFKVLEEVPKEDVFFHQRRILQPLFPLKWQLIS